MFGQFEQMQSAQALRQERELRNRGLSEDLDDDAAIRQVLRRRLGVDVDTGLPSAFNDPNQPPPTSAPAALPTTGLPANMGGGSTSASNDNRIVSGGVDLDDAIAELQRMGRGTAANRLRDKVFEWRKQQADEYKTIVDTNKTRIDMAARIAQGIKDDASFRRALPQIRELVGERYAAMLGDTYNPDIVEQMITQGMDASTLLTKQRDAFEKAMRQLEFQRNASKDDREWTAKQPDIIKSWTQIGSEYLSLSKSQDDWNIGIQLLESGVAGLPETTRHQILGRFPRQFSSANVEAVRQLPMSQSERSNERQRILDREAADRRAAAQDDEPLTPDAIEIAARSFIQGSPMRDLVQGIGKNAQINRDKILNRVAELVPDLDISRQKILYDSVRTASVDLQKLLARVRSFEQTALKNLDVFLGQAKKVVDSGSPLINRPLRAFSAQVLGSPNMAAFRTARGTIVPEFARLLGSANALGIITNEQRQEVNAMIPEDATLRQVYEAARVLKTDARNRVESAEAELTALSNLLTNDPARSGVQTVPPEQRRPSTVGQGAPPPGRGAGGGPGAAAAAGAAAGGPSVASPAGAGQPSRPGYVLMRDTDGTTLWVANADVSEALADGATIVATGTGGR